MLGKIYELQGDTDKAIEHYEKFLDLWKDADPGIPEVEDARKRLDGLKRELRTCSPSGFKSFHNPLDKIVMIVSNRSACQFLQRRENENKQKEFSIICWRELCCILVRPNGL